MSVNVAILGAAGYGGQELLRLLASHPQVHVTGVGSRRHAGKPIGAVLPQLDGFYEGLRFAEPQKALDPECGAVFLATPHGAARMLFEEIVSRREDLKVVDLSADFRLRDQATFERWYGPGHPNFARTSEFAYGLTETNRDAIARASYVANPGCFATGALLALAPLAEAGLLAGDVSLSQTTGSSGSGADATSGTHHPERAQDLRAYKVLAHQHVAEIDQELRRMGADGFETAMVPQSGAFARGIFTVTHLRLPRATDLAALFQERYAKEPFLRLREGTPALRHVVRTNFCDLAVHQEGGRAVVLTAIDNLVKGMSGQAIQNLNLMCGFDETMGLLFPGANP